MIGADNFFTWASSEKPTTCGKTDPHTQAKLDISRVTGENCSNNYYYCPEVSGAGPVRLVAIGTLYTPGAFSGTLGTVTRSTPSSKRADMVAAWMLAGSWNWRLKDPKRR